MGTKEEGGKEVICTQSNVLAQQRGVPRLSRMPAQGAPPNHTRPPPHPGCSTGPSSGQPLCKLPSPHPQARTLHPKPPSGLSQ